MKKILFLLPLILLFSCSVQKRKYLKGYQVNWNKAGNRTVEKKDRLVKNTSLKKEIPLQEARVPVYDEPLAALSSDHHTIPVEFKKKKTSLIGDEPCDELIFRDGSEIKGKVVEITPTEIKYKKCEMLDGPSYVVKKSEVFMVKFANGTREVFKDETDGTSTNNPKKTTYKGPKKVHPLSIVSIIFGILTIFPLSFVGAIIAIVSGNAALRRIAAEPDMYKGEGLAMTGKTIGIVYLGIVAFILFLFILVAILG